MAYPFESFIAPALIDPHGHLREDSEEEYVVAPLIEHALHGCATVIGLMPNLKAGILNAPTAISYSGYCEKRVPEGSSMQFIPYLQITEDTTREEVDRCVEAGILDAKVYPIARTTKSHLGVRDYTKIISIVAYAGTKGMRVHFHPEHPNMLFNNRDAEYLFLPILDMFMRETDTVIISEHGTDARCIPFWKDWARTGRFYLTLTGHHLVADENTTYGDVQATCKPPYKTSYDQFSLVDLVAEDHEWIMAGGDSAAHPKGSKHTLGPCACGAFTAPFLMALYAHALRDMFHTHAGREVFKNFTSGNARTLYGIPMEATPPVVIQDRLTAIPERFQVGSWDVEPFWAGRELSCSARFV